MPSAAIKKVEHQLVETQERLQQVSEQLAKDTSPVAIDAERASGYRYFQRAYLLQIKHPNHGIFLIDPTAISDVTPLSQSLANREWVIHAAIQDLPCLTELGLTPSKLFDTELAGRLLGLPRVALAVMLDTYLGVKLKKQHSAADWSRRPLPPKWLEYAALDVEYLIELKSLVEAELAATGKLNWANEEFEALTSFSPSPKSDQPWRRLSGVHLIADPRARAVARSLWYARDDLAQKLDIAPGRLLPDSAILAAAQATPVTRAQIEEIEGFLRTESKRHLELWWQAIEKAMSEPKDQLPPRSARERPFLNRGSASDPQAAQRLANARVALTEISQEFSIPTENLVTAGALRSAAALAPSKLTGDDLARILSQGGARPWQVEVVTNRLLEALKSPVPLTPPAAAQ